MLNSPESYKQRELRERVLFDAPNLDGISNDEHDLREAARVLRLLAKYSTIKAEAMYCRKRGWIGPATLYEARAEEVYQKLPKWARW